MNTTALEPLKDRWPDDHITPLSISNFTKIFKTNGKSAYLDSLVMHKSDQACIMNFAQDNGYTYSELNRNDLRVFTNSKQWKSNPAWLGFVGASTLPLITHQVMGKVYGFDATFCLAYSDITQSESQTPLTFSQKSLIRIKLPKLFPQLVLDSNKNDKSLYSSIDTSFKGDQKLTLEGNFDTYFDFYAPKGVQANTLSVLAPNFMQMVIDSSSTFDVEFFGNEMILTTRDPLYTPEGMTEALKILEVQLKYLQRLLSSWNYRPIHTPFDTLEQTVVGGTVVKIGRTRIPPVVFLVLILVFFFGPILVILLVT